MGTVHAKEPEGAVFQSQEQPRQPQYPQFDTVKARVQSVIIDGLDYTKDDLLVKEVQPILQAENFEEMVKRSHNVKLKLERLEIFKKIDISIDTHKGPDPTKTGYDVTFAVQERRPVSGGINTLIGNNDASLLFTLRMPNVFGRAEKLNVDYTHGTKQTRGHSVSFSKPLKGNPDVRLSGGVYQSHGEYPWSGYKETDRGLSVDLSFPFVFGTHCLKWEGVWRDLRALSRTTSFSVREQAGHSIKSSLVHMFVRDKRDDRILPSSGTLFKLVQEYAGLGGDVGFVKNDVEFQANKLLFWDTVVQVSLAGGIMKSLDPSKETKINDKFFLGGPLTLRGFSMKGVGPHSEGNALGADAYCLCALHLYTPLPFRPGKGGFGELFRTHLFINAGHLGTISSERSVKENLWQLSETLRWVYGGGIVLRMGKIARLELNYVVPMCVQKGDSVNPGLQFGIGLTFL